MPITEDLLRQLGFAQQNPPHIWILGAIGSDDRLRLSYTGDVWRLERGDRHVSAYLTSPAALLEAALAAAYQAGVRDAHSRLHAALGLDRLMEQVVDRVTDRVTDQIHDSRDD